MSPNRGHFVPPASQEQAMSAAAATELVRKMIDTETARAGSAERAMRRLEASYGIGFWTLDHLRRGRAKTVDGSLLGRIRSAYVDLCQSQIAKLQSEIYREMAAGDDTLADLELEVRALAQKVAAKKAGQR